MRGHAASNDGRGGKKGEPRSLESPAARQVLIQFDAKQSQPDCSAVAVRSRPLHWRRLCNVLRQAVVALKNEDAVGRALRKSAAPRLDQGFY